ncbi:carbamoyl-phosphate synthase large subunit, partial [Lacticaseibacillus paracasei]
GEVMAIGRTLEESLLKAVRSLEVGLIHPEWPAFAKLSDDELSKQIIQANDERLFYLAEAFRRDYTIEEVAELSKMNPFFLDKIKHIVELERELAAHKADLGLLAEVKRYGFADEEIA